MLLKRDKKFRTKTSQKEDQLALKNIVEPFLSWHNSLFGSCFEDIKKFPDHTKLIEEYVSRDGGFEVNKETLYNILSAELQGGSKVQSLRTFQILPTVPASIAKGTNLEKKTYSYKLSESYKRESDGTKNLTCKQKCPNFNKDTYLTSDDFVDTEDLCQNLKHLRIIAEFMHHSKEYREYRMEMVNKSKPVSKETNDVVTVSRINCSKSS